MVRNFYYIFSGNRALGPLFVVFIVADLPINLQVIMWILFGQFNRIQAPFAVLLLGAQIIGIFGCHYMMSIYSRKIHRPAKWLFHYLIRASDLLVLRSRIKWIQCIWVLHSTNPYGVTYGSFGLVSLASFGKVWIWGHVRK